MKKLLQMLSRAHPILIVAAGTIAASLAFIVAFGVHLYIPNGHSTLFATEHYVAPLFASFAIAYGARCGWSLNGASITAMLKEVGKAIFIVLGYTVIVFLHFNFKLWAHLVNPVRWDEAYQRLDDALPLLILTIRFFHAPWDELTERWPHAYHDVFVGMFLLSLAIHAVRAKSGTVLTELATAIALVLTIGGMSYAVAPALGPFVFSAGFNPTATDIQLHMLAFQTRFITSGGTAFDGAEFVSALGAMPSLHTAHAFIFLYYAWKDVRWMGYLYIPAFIFIVTEAIAAKWHYFIDLPIGLAIALLSIRLAAVLTRRHVEYQSRP